MSPTMPPNPHPHLAGHGGCLLAAEGREEARGWQAAENLRYLGQGQRACLHLCVEVMPCVCVFVWWASTDGMGQRATGQGAPPGPPAPPAAPCRPTSSRSSAASRANSPISASSRAARSSSFRTRRARRCASESAQSGRPQAPLPATSAACASPRSSCGRACGWDGPRGSPHANPNAGERRPPPQAQSPYSQHLGRAPARPRLPPAPFPPARTCTRSSAASRASHRESRRST